MMIGYIHMYMYYSVLHHEVRLKFKIYMQLQIPQRPTVICGDMGARKWDGSEPVRGGGESKASFLLLETTLQIHNKA